MKVTLPTALKRHLIIDVSVCTFVYACVYVCLCVHVCFVCWGEEAILPEGLSLKSQCPASQDHPCGHSHLRSHT